MDYWVSRIVLWATLLLGVFLTPWMVFIEHVEVAPGAWILCAMCLSIIAMECYWVAVD